jgi:hypothetical protein
VSIRAKNPRLVITTPSASIVETPNGKLRIEWAQGFGTKATRHLATVQEYIDSEVLRRSQKFIPMRTGALIRSGILHTEIGSGEVSWATPYARSQYYRTKRTRAYDPLRGSHWFERMKNAELPALVRGVERFGRGRR